jgi:Predicted RNA binding protein (contains ribosomal protein S1 domain)
MLGCKKGDKIKVIVTNIAEYGIFIKYNDYSGLIHISEIAHEFVKDVSDYAQNGDEIEVEVLAINEDEKTLKLSLKSLQEYNPKTTKNRGKIEETKHGFSTLEHYLPIWIEESIKNEKKRINSIDKDYIK